MTVLVPIMTLNDDDDVTLFEEIVTWENIA